MLGTLNLMGHLFAAVVAGAAWAATAAGATVTPTVTVSGDSAADEWSFEASAPPSVSVLSEKEIQKKNKTNVADILREMPGVSVTNSGGAGQPTGVFIRGMRPEDTLVIIDGIVVNDAMSPTRGFDFSNLESSGIEKIEVLRGPQAVVFGANATGGVILITTKSGMGPSKLSGSIEAGSFETLRGSLNVAGEANSVDYAVGMTGFQTHGYSAVTSQGADYKNGFDRLTLNSKIGYNATSARRFEWNSRFLQSHSDLPLTASVSAPNSSSQIQQLSTGVTVRDRFFSERVQSSLGLYFMSVERSDQSIPGTAPAQWSEGEFSSQTQKLETQHEWLIRPHHSLRLSGQYMNEAGGARTKAAGVTSEIARQDQSVYGGGLTYKYDNEWWLMEAGARWDEHSPRESLPTYRLSLGRRLFPDRRLFLQGVMSSAYRLPSLYQLYSSYGDSHLQTEKVESWELSAQLKISDSMDIKSTYFSTTSRDLIDFNLVTSKYGNIKTGRSQGVELQWQMRVAPHLRLIAVDTWLETRDESTGRSLLRRPQNVLQLTSRADYDKFYLSLDYRIVGERDDVDPATLQRFSAHPYEVASLRGGYNFSSRWRAVGRLENLLDRRYEEIAGYRAAAFAAYLGVELY